MIDLRNIESRLQAGFRLTVIMRSGNEFHAAISSGRVYHADNAIGSTLTDALARLERFLISQTGGPKP
jgi:hypothetical protein